jgi:hypothetical protein
MCEIVVNLKFYSWQRPNGSLGEKTLSQYSSKWGNETPFWSSVLDKPPLLAAIHIFMD